MAFEFPFAAVPENAYCFLFCDDELLTAESGGTGGIPSASQLKAQKIAPERAYHIGRLDGKECYAAAGGRDVPPGFGYKKIRQIHGQIEDACYWRMLRGFHIATWRRKNRFCSRCGGPMAAAADEIAVTCAACGQIVYPRISPAIIVAVTKGDKILLAHSHRFPAGRYSVIAGFVEPGEALEDCVQRELKEEVGIDVADIRYFASQPWPFPDSLMVAFTARWAAGEITVDNNEIDDAGWYGADNLPNLPARDSVARQLIDWFVAERRLSG